jgi:hypothetical protein
MSHWTRISGGKVAAKSSWLEAILALRNASAATVKIVDLPLIASLDRDSRDLDVALNDRTIRDDL